MKKILGKEFYSRSALEVAPDMLGKFLVCNKGAFQITDVEAYTGADDKACHAHKGRTPRTEVLFGESGYWYVYLVYGMYNMLNVVVDDVDIPAAVLIRGVKGIDGPGKLTRDLSINRRFNKKMATKRSGLWIEDREVKVMKKDIRRTPRIGVQYAGDWASKPYRFIIST